MFVVGAIGVFITMVIAQQVDVMNAIQIMHEYMMINFQFMIVHENNCLNFQVKEHIQLIMIAI